MGILLLDASSTGAMEPVLSALGEFILAPILCISLMIAYWAIKQMNAAKDAHITALEELGDKREDATRSYVEAYQTTASATTSTMETMIRTQELQIDALKAIAHDVDQIKSSVDRQQGTLAALNGENVRTLRPMSEGR